jgi:hypothetical protein
MEAFARYQLDFPDEYADSDCFLQMVESGTLLTSLIGTFTGFTWTSDTFNTMFSSANSLMVNKIDVSKSCAS